MEFVCSEVEEKSAWYYLPEREIFFCMDRNKNILRKISGRNLPDPDDLERGREAQVMHLSDKEKVGIRIKCSDSVHAMWKFWQKQIDRKKVKPKEGKSPRSVCPTCDGKGVV